MGRLAAFVFALVALLFQLRAAHACVNATIDDAATERVKEAERWLYGGDYVVARELAAEVATGEVAATENVKTRAHHVVALSFIRDPGASKADIDRATETLRLQLLAQQVPSPALQADLGEAYARKGEDEAAYQTLSGIAERDLIGSPHAYAALARVATKRGDSATAKNALERCAQMTSDPNVCRGVYPAAPLLHGHTLGYALPGIFATFALVRRRRAKRPWSTYGDELLAAIILATCAFVFAYARSPATTTVVSFAVLVLVGLAQRLAFLSAVKHDRVAGFVLRDAAPEDDALPAIASFFHGGARVLEHVPDASYREPARVGVVRLTPRRRGALAVTILGVVVLALFAGCSLLTMRTTKSASVSVGLQG